MLVDKKVLISFAEAAGSQAVPKHTDFGSLEKCSFTGLSRQRVRVRVPSLPPFLSGSLVHECPASSPAES